MVKQYFCFFIILLAFASQAHAEGIVVIVHPNAGIEAMSKNEIAQIYLGKSKKLVPYDQADSSKLRAAFYRAITGRNLKQIKSIWSKLVFSGRAQAPEQLINSKAVKRTIEVNLNAIGYIESSEADAKVKVVFSIL